MPRSAYAIRRLKESGAMQLTLESEIVGLTYSDRAAMDDLMLRYCSARRVAFNQLLRGQSLVETIHRLESMATLGLNWRYCEHAARDASAAMKSQRELLPLYLSETYDRIEETERRLQKLEQKARQEKRATLEMRLSRLNKRRTILAGHIAKGTLPKVIFGTRSLFVARAEGRVTKEAWRNARNDQLYSIGQANQHGNANIRIGPQGDRVGVNFPSEIQARNTRKGVVRVKSERRWLSLRVPGAYKDRLSTMLASGMAHSVRVTRKGERYLAHVSFEIHNTVMNGVPKRVLAVDSNPEGFAATVVTKDGNMWAHRFFRDDRLIYASEKKRGCLIGQLVGDIISYARENGADAVVVEDLNIAGHRSFGRRVNRIVYAFVRGKFFENLLTRAWKGGYPVFTVNPAYTSKVGDTKYRERHGLSIHEAAALCIGRRFFGHGERLEEPMLVTVKRSRRKESASVRYLWPSLYGYHRPSDPYMAPPGRKGSREERTVGGDGAVFTGRPASGMTPQSESDEGVRKGGECGESPQATGNGGEPAPPSGGGKATAGSERIG